MSQRLKTQHSSIETIVVKGSIPDILSLSTIVAKDPVLYKVLSDAVKASYPDMKVSITPAYKELLCQIMTSGNLVLGDTSFLTITTDEETITLDSNCSMGRVIIALYGIAVQCNNCMTLVDAVNIGYFYGIYKICRRDDCYPKLVVDYVDRTIPDILKIFGY